VVVVVVSFLVSVFSSQAVTAIGVNNRAATVRAVEKVGFIACILRIASLYEQLSGMEGRSPIRDIA
jgi:hypothetical protein